VLSHKQLLKKARSLNEKAGREKARRKQALQQKQFAVRSRLAVAGASSRAALRGELADGAFASFGSSGGSVASAFSSL